MKLRPGTSLLTLIFGVLLLGGITGPASASTPVPRVDGNVIREATTGKEFIPHGVNWPSFEYACEQGWGHSNPGAGPATAEAMLEWNINTVRLPLNQDCWLGDDGLPASQPWILPRLTATGYRKAVESFVGDLTSAGIVTILDLHWSAPPGFRADGLRPMPDSRSDDFWLSVAGRFRNNPGVIFDLFNEPHSRWDPDRQKAGGAGTGDWDFRLTWNIWLNGGGAATNHADTDYPFTNPGYRTTGMAELLRTVRLAGATQPVILSGLDYANDLSRWLEFAPGDDQLIAGFHNYPGQRCNSETCWNREIAELAAEVPVITAEVGQNDCRFDHVARYVDWADDFHIGYLAWAWWDLDLPGAAPSCTNFALIDDLDGTPTGQYGAAFRNHLISLPETFPPVKTLPRRDPRLRIRSAWFRQRKLYSEIRLDPGAIRPVTVKVKLVAKIRNRKRRRTLSLKPRPVDGQIRLRRRIPGRWTPARLIVRYGGDAKLLPARSNRLTKVVIERRKSRN
ncbi:MAG: glycoside hydrolase family 5 protein [Actinomycetota bacterium]|nr:glycoside hydrolase family 5 protein [Actinomycetota bacterium]